MITSQFRNRKVIKSNKIKEKFILVTKIIFKWLFYDMH